MIITLSVSERDCMLGWAETAKKRAGRYGNGNAAFPDEEFLISLLKSHTGGPLNLGMNKITIILSWIENAVDKNFGRGPIMDPLEQQIFDKVQAALHSIENGTGPNKTRQSKRSTEITSIINGASNPKRGFLFVVPALILAVLVASFSVLYFLFRQKPSAHVPADKKYTAEFIVGNVYKKSDTHWISLNFGDQVEAGDSLKTDNESRLTILNGAGGRFSVSGGMSVKLEEF